MVAVEIDKLFGEESIGEFLSEQFGVGVADAKGDHGAHIAKDGLPDLGDQLVKVLMR